MSNPRQEATVYFVYRFSLRGIFAAVRDVVLHWLYLRDTQSIYDRVRK